MVLKSKFSKEALHAELGRLVTGDIHGTTMMRWPLLGCRWIWLSKIFQVLTYFTQQAQQQNIGTTLNLY